jgi:L-asparaginase / beta-aspartyl-peptidase
MPAKHKINTTEETFADVVIAVHGGAGEVNRRNINEVGEREYVKHLQEALKAGFELVKKGKSALDAVETAVRYLEDCPLFNAGHGAVFTCDGKNELDAAIMDGKNRAAGAVASVHTLKNPISAARAVMEKTEHVLLVGKGAERFASAAGLEIVEPSYFRTEKRWQQWQDIVTNSHNGKEERPVLEFAIGDEEEGTAELEPSRKHGTVGAVALDKKGNLAAATSTGGMVNKRYGRVGDSPIIGAGTYADNATCAISATGHGEYFMRAVAAYEVAALMKYKRLSLARAAQAVVGETLVEMGGSGGLIALDAAGNCAIPFNTDGMFRGCVTRSGTVYAAIFGE